MKTRILRCLTAKMAVGALLNRCLAERMGFGRQLLLERPFGQRHIIGLVLLFFHGLAKCCKRTICFFQSFIVLGVEHANFGSIAAPKSLRDPAGGAFFSLTSPASGPADSQALCPLVVRNWTTRAVPE